MDTFSEAHIWWKVIQRSVLPIKKKKKKKKMRKTDEETVRLIFNAVMAR